LVQSLKINQAELDLTYLTIILSFRAPQLSYPLGLFEGVNHS
jgi:hypothetical protein